MWTNSDHSTLLREQVLTEIHEGHTGIVHMKAVARMHVWWPNIDRKIESCVYECDDCQRNSRNPARAPLHPWEQPEKPWKRLHIDFAGPFCGSVWLILVDAQSKWSEVIQMKQFELGWYGATNVRRIPFCSQSSLYSSDTNWGPLSETS